MTDNITPGSENNQVTPDLTFNLAGEAPTTAAPTQASVPAEPITAVENQPESTVLPTANPATVAVQFTPLTPNENPFSLGANAATQADAAAATPIKPEPNQMHLAFAVIAGILVLGGVGYGSYLYTSKPSELHSVAPAVTQENAVTEAVDEEPVSALNQASSQTQVLLHGSACEPGMNTNEAGDCVCDLENGNFGVDQQTADALAVKLSNNSCATCDLVTNRIDALTKAGDALSLKLKTQLETTAKEHGCGTALANYDDKIKVAFDQQDWAKYLQLSFEKFDIAQKNLPQANALKWKILFTKDLALKLSSDKTTTSKTMEFLKNQIASLQVDLLTKCPSCVDTKKACADMTADYATVARFDKIFDQNQDTLAGSSLIAPAPKKVRRTQTAVTDINAPDEAATKALDLNTVSFSKIFGSDYYVKNCLSTTTTATKK